jgi:hypothetical protein
MHPTELILRKGVTTLESLVRSSRIEATTHSSLSSANDAALITLCWRAFFIFKCWVHWSFSFL